MSTRPFYMGVQKHVPTRARPKNCIHGNNGVVVLRQYVLSIMMRDTGYNSAWEQCASNVAARASKEHQMQFGRVFAIIFGILIIIGGGYCIFTPVETFTTLSWLVAVVMVADGIANAVTWFQMRKMGVNNVWPLIGAIASVILGVVILFNFFAQYVVEMILIYMLAIWLIIGGAIRIFMSLKIRSAYNQGRDVSQNWVPLLILGIAILIIGVISLFDPLGLMATIGVFMGITILSMGVGVIGLALAQRE